MKREGNKKRTDMMIKVHFFGQLSQESFVFSNRWLTSCQARRLSHFNRNDKQLKLARNELPIVSEHEFDACHHRIRSAAV